MSGITTTIAWRMGRGGEQRGDTMGPFEDGTLADTHWRAGFDALADTLPKSVAEGCPKPIGGSGCACSMCPFYPASCDRPNPPRHQ